MIQQIFGVANRFYRILRYKQESLISNIVADNKLNAAADKAVNTDKKQDTTAGK